MKYVAGARASLAIWFAALALLTGYGAAARAEPPRSLGSLGLVHAVQGKEALRHINRLHGKGVGAIDGYVAHYEKDGAAAVLYRSQASSRAEATGQLGRMTEAIRRGDGPFHDLKASRRGEATVYSVLGQGQKHYFFQRDASVLWLAVDAAVAKPALAALFADAKIAPRAVRRSQESQGP